MFFPQTNWWDSSRWVVPDSMKYVSERWWELLKDWRGITVYSPPCSYVLSVLEDLADVIDDLQAGRLRSSYQLDSLRDELIEILRTDRLLHNAFPSETASTIAQLDNLYNGLSPDPQQKYADLKKRKTECKRAASAIRRLHHRCFKRRTTEPDMTWPGLGGLVGCELIQELESAQPSYQKIERLTISLLLDCLYRGYDLDYLTTLFDRYLPEENGLRAGLLHVFRRLHSLMRHEYGILLILKGAATVRIEPGKLSVIHHTRADLDQFEIGQQDRDSFLRQSDPDNSVILGIHWAGAPDAGAAAEAARNELQEIVDYLDFQSPVQKFEIAPLCIVTWTDNDGRKYYRLHPDSSGEQPPRHDHSVEIDSEWAEQLSGLAEALRWSAVARRERTPEVSLLACWFAFEFLAGNLEKTPVEGIMEFFPKVLAIANLRRRALYWWRCVQGHPAFETQPHRDSLLQKTTFHGGSTNILGVVELLIDAIDLNPSPLGAAVMDIARASVLLRERTLAEGKLFTNHQLLAQTVREDAKVIQRELQGFLVIRNKLVHRARIDHPLLPVVSQRAKARLYDLLRDISGQLTSQRLHNTVGEVLHDFRDTFDELLVDLGQGPIPLQSLVHRITLS